MAPFKNIPSQTQILYQDGWTALMDTTFLYSLIKNKQAAGSHDAEIPKSALFAAQMDINMLFEMNFIYEDIVNRKLFMEQRYWTFKQINARKSPFHWNQETNIVSGEDSAWFRIFKNHVKIKSGNRIINLDGCSKNSDDDEVTSPIPKTPRRRLFEDEHVDNYEVDEESTNNMGHSHTTRGKQTEMNPPLANALPPGFKESSSQDSRKGNTSSCASSSPFRWKYNPFK